MPPSSGTFLNSDDIAKMRDAAQKAESFDRRLRDVETALRGNEALGYRGLLGQIVDLRAEIKPILKDWQATQEFLTKEVEPLVKSWEEIRILAKWGRWIVPLLGASTLATLVVQLIDAFVKAKP